MRVIGVDPGTAILGWAYLEIDDKKEISKSSLKYGAIITDKKLEMPDRLVILRDEFAKLVKEFKPDVLGVEQLFFNTNITTAITVAEARGVIMAEARSKGAKVYEMTPLQVKDAVVGYGKAGKSQVQNMVKLLMGLKEIPKPDDAADAIAVAICAAGMASFQQQLQKS